MKLTTVLLGAVLVGCAPAGQMPLSTPATAPLSSTLDSIARAYLANEPGVPGAQIAVWHHGRLILSRGYGYSEVDSRRQVDATTVFRIASLTKQFTAAAVVNLAAKGKLSLDDPLTRWIPEYASGEHMITLRHLLNHTSGLVDAAELRESADAVTERAFLESIRNRSPAFFPGERFLYSNTGYRLLGIVIERASGRSFAEYIQRTFTTPQRLASLTYCPNTPALNQAHGHRSVEQGLAPAQPTHMSQHSSAGALCANAADLVRWSHLLITGKIVSDSLVREMVSPPTVRSGTTTYGYGLGVGSPSGVGRISHTGAINGFASVLAYYPEHDLGVAVLFNVESAPPSRLASLLASTVLGVEIPSIADLSTSAEVRARYLGVYDLGPLQLTIFERNGQVWAQGTGQPPNRLLYQGSDEFRLALDPSVRFVFQLEAGRAIGFVLHQGGGTLSAKRIE